MKIEMRVLALLFFFIFMSEANARSIHGSGSTTGSSQVNVGETEGAIINVLKAAGNNFTTNYNPGEFDDSGYPKAGTVTTGPLYSIPMSTAFTGPTTTWVFQSPSTRGSFIFYINDPISISSISAGCTNSLSTVITQTAGQSCRVEFTFSAPTSNLGIGIGAGSYTGGTGEIAMFRKGADETDYNAGIYWTREYFTNLRTLNPRTIRSMPWMNGSVYAQAPANNVTNQVNWAERSKPADLFWTSHFPTATWGGAISGTDQYTIAAAPGTAGTWVANEVIQGKFANAPTNIQITGAVAADASHCSTATVGRVCLTVSSASTLSGTQSSYIAGVAGTTEANGKQTITKIDSTHVALNSVVFSNAYSSGGYLSTASLTITGKSGGAKLLLAFTGTPFYYSGFAPLDGNNPSGLGTMYYNDVQDVVIWSSGGVAGMPPIEAQVQLANTISSNLWISIPPFFTVAAAQSMTAQVRDLLNPSLVGYFEYGNEIWNGNFPATIWAAVQGIALGIPFANNEALHGWYGLRHKQMMGGIYTTWTASRSASSLRRVFAHQAYGASDVVTYRMNGGDLNPTSNSALCLYLGGTFSGSCSGAPNYSASPNRPIDAADVQAYATYFSGANMVNFDANYTSANTAFLQNLATLYNGGSVAAAKALLDDDFRQGTTNTQSVTVAGGTTFTASGTNFANNDTVVGTTTGSFFTGLSLNTPYFVVNVSGSTFKVAATQGGTALTGISGGTGTQSFGKLGGSVNQTLLDLSTRIYRNVLSNTTANPGWEAVATTYDVARAGFTPALAPLRVELYEGALEASAPSAGTCGSLGITIGGSSATAATVLANLLLAYKNDVTYGRNIVTSQFKQFMGQDATAPTSGLMAHSKTPSWFLDAGPTQWSLMNSDIGVADYYQLYYGFASYSSGVP